MALTLINPNDLAMPGKQELTPESNLRTIKNNLKNFLAWYYDTGNKLTQTEPRNIIVMRENGRNLAIKISNETWNLIPLKDDNDVEQINKVIEELDEYKERLYQFKLWCNKITGVKNGRNIHTRPQESY